MLRFEPAMAHGRSDVVDAGDVELSVRQTFARLLCVPLERIVADADVFALGVTSIVALQALVHLAERWNVQLDPDSLFDAPTSARLAAHIRALRAAHQHAEPFVV